MSVIYLKLIKLNLKNIVSISGHKMRTLKTTKHEILTKINACIAVKKHIRNKLFKKFKKSKVATLGRQLRGNISRSAGSANAMLGKNMKIMVRSKFQVPQSYDKYAIKVYIY